MSQTTLPAEVRIEYLEGRVNRLVEILEQHLGRDLFWDELGPTR